MNYKTQIRCKLEIDGKMVEKIMEFKYLGVIITSSGDLVREVKTQAQQAARVTGSLNDLVWRNKYIRKETKSKHIR